MGNCCCQDPEPSKQEQEVNRLRQQRQLKYLTKQLAEKSVNTEMQKDSRGQSSVILKQDHEQQLRNLNQIIEIQRSKVASLTQRNVEMQQELKRTKQSMIRVNRTVQQTSINEKQNQQQAQRERLYLLEENKKLIRLMQDRDKFMEQKQKNIQSTVNSICQTKISQIKQEQQQKLQAMKAQLEQKKKQFERLRTQSSNQIGSYRQNELKLKSDLTKLSSQQQQIRRQLQQQRRANNLKSQKLEQVRFDSLFQNEIFSGKDHYKKYLTTVLQDRYNQKIIKTKLLYTFDPNNKLNFHRSIDEIPSIAVIVKLENGCYLAGYTEGPFIPKVAPTRDALLVSLTNKRVFYLAEENKRAITYDDYYIIFGNSELRLRSQENRVFSNFGISNGYFANRGETVNILLGTGNEREVDLSYYQIYEVVFEGI